MSDYDASLIGPRLEDKWQEYLAKDGDENDTLEFWAWLVGARHKCYADPGEIIVSRDTLERALKDSAHLRHLQAKGVDNWEGYSYPNEDEDDE